ncbi:MAG: hypothetical protein JWN83_904 [Chitinophagaceae bacterium]|nr:hypothetical protein [Chitinophagaceae bacterium]
MHRLLALLGFVLFINPIQAQNSFSFNCLKDTTIDCTTQCLTLRTVIPDIYSLSNSYTVNRITDFTCFRPYVNPASQGPSARLTIDDRYSPIIDITFPFSFFGNTYNKLIASTNGFLSFDTLKALAFSHFGILKNGAALSSLAGTPENLPSSLYDKALIMGPYQDLDPNNSLSSQQIKYDIVGTAPYRKWIISYYNEPLYTTACLNLNKNTQQIVLYETLGIVEVFVFDKDICTNWNAGRTMIGMQDFNKTNAIMTPGRYATDAPWGTQGMNESWRFVPSAGQSLFKRVELYTLSGSFVTAGNTSSAPNNLLDVSFDNVCPPAAGASYLVKSFYKNPDGSAAEIVSTDTINISRGDPITTNILPPNCTAGSTGDITILSPVGAQYEYSLDGINWQSSTLFKLPAGTYTIRARIIGNNCISSKIISVSPDALDAVVKVNITACPGPITASIDITPSRGTAPYTYSLNGGAFQSSNIFTNLSAGTYKLIVNDAAGCTFSTDINISATNMATASITNTVCGTTGTGSITVSPGFGTGPYTYSINGGTSQSSNIFTGLVGGTYKIVVKDATSCSFTFDAVVTSNALISAKIDMTMPTCYGNTNGSLIVHPLSAAAPFSFSLNTNPFQADSTFKNLAAGNYILHIKDSLGCVKDTSIILNQPNLFRISTITTSASTCSNQDGEIFIKANGGTTPYQYSIDSGKTFTANNIFSVVADLYLIKVKDANGCTAQDTTTVDALDKDIKVNLGPDKAICSGSSVTLSATTLPQARFYTWSPAASLDDSTSATPVATPVDTTTYILTAKSIVCFGYDTITINVLHKPVANAGTDTIICYNNFATLRGSATNLSGGVKYLWTPANEIINPNSATTIARPKNARSNAYILQVSDTYGCNFKAYDEVIVTMTPPVAAFAGNDTVASIGIPHQLFGSGGVKYVWSPAYVLDNPLNQNPVAILSDDTKFNLIVRDTLGCVGTSSVTVKVYKGTNYYIPNAFTPNGDGLNDVFRAIAPGVQVTNYFRIFNRWGKLLFETRDARKGWDGTYAGVPQPSAVYVWVIKGLDVSQKIIELKGTVTLIR